MILDGPLVLPHKHKLVLWRRGFPLKLCKCGFVSGVNPKVGSNTIDVGAAGAGDITRWSGSAAAIAAGDIGMSALSSESGNGRLRAFVESESKDIAPFDSVIGSGRRKIQRSQQDAGLTSIISHGHAAPATVGTASLVDVATGEGQFIQYLSGAVSGNQGGFDTLFNRTQFDRRPIIDIAMRTAASILVQRTWSGAFSADPMASDTPAVHLMAFRYSPATDGTAFWRCVTDSGSGVPTVTVTTVAVTTTTSYRFRIVVDGAGANVRFYINGILVATHTTTLPGATTDLGYVHKVQTIEAVAKGIRFGALTVSQKGKSVV